MGKASNKFPIQLALVEQSLFASNSQLLIERVEFDQIIVCQLRESGAWHLSDIE